MLRLEVNRTEARQFFTYCRVPPCYTDAVLVGCSDSDGPTGTDGLCGLLIFVAAKAG